jgi:hypothetical protein
MGRAFQAMVAAGLLGLAAMGWYQATRADRLRTRAEAGGLASAEILVREMG